MQVKTFTIVISFLIACFFISCSRKRSGPDERIAVNAPSHNVNASDSLGSGNTTANFFTYPNEVILTGLADHRLVTIYKPGEKRTKAYSLAKYSSYESDVSVTTEEEHYMPGIDMLSGYNLLNIVHYDLTTERANPLFKHPVLIEALYYPSFVQDSIDKQPITRDYYMVSVYDEDTNNDTIIDRNDLRRFYHFDPSGAIKTRLIPSDYSAMQAQYDSKNDVMYIFARHDENKNGTEDTVKPIESIHVFWINLKTPAPAKLLY